MQTADSVLDLRDTSFSGYGAASPEGVVEQCLQAVLVHCGLLEGEFLDSTSASLPLAGSVNNFTRTMPLGELRQTGRLRDLTREAQSTLLGGTLCQYSADVDPLPRSEARQAVLAVTAGAHRDLGSMQAPERVIPGEGMSTLRQSFQRLVGVREAAEETAPQQGDLAQSGTMTMTVLENELAATARANVITDAAQGDVLDEETLLAASLTEGNNVPLSDMLPPAMLFEEAPNAWVVDELGDTTMSLAQMENTLLGQSLGGTLTIEEVDGGLIEALRRLAEGDSLDDVLLRTANRVFQVGTLLSDQRLSDSEIGSLPKVRFASKDEQNCAICLEAYQPEELLTALPCSHFFHIDCLAKWLQRSPKCPLCRGPPKAEQGSE